MAVTLHLFSPWDELCTHTFWLFWLSLGFPILISVSSSYFICTCVPCHAYCICQNPILLPITDSLRLLPLPLPASHCTGPSDLTSRFSYFSFILQLLLSLSSAHSFLAYGESSEGKRRSLCPPIARISASASHGRNFCFGVVRTPWSVLAFGFPIVITEMIFSCCWSIMLTCVSATPHTPLWLACLSWLHQEFQSEVICQNCVELTTGILPLPEPGGHAPFLLLSLELWLPFSLAKVKSLQITLLRSDSCVL